MLLRYQNIRIGRPSTSNSLRTPAPAAASHSSVSGARRPGARVAAAGRQRLRRRATLLGAGCWGCGCEGVARGRTLGQVLWLADGHPVIAVVCGCLRGHGHLLDCKQQAGERLRPRTVRMRDPAAATTQQRDAHPSPLLPRAPAPAAAPAAVPRASCCCCGIGRAARRGRWCAGLPARVAGARKTPVAVRVSAASRLPCCQGSRVWCGEAL